MSSSSAELESVALDDDMSTSTREEDSKAEALAAKKAKMASGKSNLPYVYLSVFVDGAGLALISPLLPVFAKNFNATALELGILFSGYPLCQVAAFTIMGKFSDKYGRRPALLISIAGSTIGFLLQSLSNTMLDLTLARAATGLFGGSVPIAMGLISDVAEPEERPRLIALVGTTMSLSFLFSPAISSGLAVFGLQVPMYVATCLAFGGWMVTWAKVKETNKAVLRNGSSSSSSSSKSDGVDASDVTLEEGKGKGKGKGVAAGDDDDDDDESEGQEKEVTVDDPLQGRRSLILLLCFAGFCMMVNFITYMSMYGFYTIQRFGFGSLEMGFLLSGSALSIALTQSFLYPVLVRKYGKHAVGILGGFMLGVSTLLMTLPQQFGPAVPILVANMTGFSFLSPSIASILARYAPTGQTGKVLGMNESAGALARVLGPPLSGLIFDVNPDATFYFSGAFALLAGIIMAVVLYLNKSVKSSLLNTAAESDLRATMTGTELLDMQLGAIDASDRNETLQAAGKAVYTLLLERGFEVESADDVEAIVAKYVPDRRASLSADEDVTKVEMGGVA